jgi:hypothetical protein
MQPSTVSNSCYCSTVGSNYVHACLYLHLQITAALSLHTVCICSAHHCTHAQLLVHAQPLLTRLLTAVRCTYMYTLSYQHSVKTKAEFIEDKSTNAPTTPPADKYPITNGPDLERLICADSESEFASLYQRYNTRHYCWLHHYL